MSNHNICFHGEIRKVLYGYSLCTIHVFVETHKNKNSKKRLLIQIPTYLNYGYLSDFYTCLEMKS